MATLNKHAARTTRTSTTADRDAVPESSPGPRPRWQRGIVPHAQAAYGMGIATVCSLALVNLLAGAPATATVEPSASVAVAEALGIEGSGIVEQPPAEDAELLGRLAASRAERDADRAAAAAAQAQAEQEAAAEAEAERIAAEEAAAAAAAEAEAAAAAAAEAEAQAAEAAEAEPAPSAGTAVTAIAQISNSMGPVRPQAQAAADAVVSNVPGAAGITIGGTRASAADPGGHPSGLALDYMVLSDTGLGNAIVDYHIANWDALGVEYIIWQQRYLDSPGGSWSSMEDRGSPTANHMDHPHVNYLG